MAVMPGARTRVNDLCRTKLPKATSLSHRLDFWGFLLFSSIQDVAMCECECTSDELSHEQSNHSLDRMHQPSMRGTLSRARSPLLLQSRQCGVHCA